MLQQLYIKGDDEKQTVPIDITSKNSFKPIMHT